MKDRTGTNDRLRGGHRTATIDQSTHRRPRAQRKKPVPRSPQRPTQRMSAAARTAAVRQALEATPAGRDLARLAGNWSGARCAEVLAAAGLSSAPALICSTVPARSDWTGPKMLGRTEITQGDLVIFSVSTAFPA